MILVEDFLLADTSMKVVLGIFFFFIFSSADKICREKSYLFELHNAKPCLLDTIKRIRLWLQMKYHSSHFRNTGTSNRSTLYLLQRPSSLCKGLRSNISIKTIVLKDITSYYIGEQYLVQCKTTPCTILQGDTLYHIGRQYLVLC